MFIFLSLYLRYIHINYSLMILEPEDRLGSREGVAELRATEWLRDFKFNELRRAALISPLKTWAQLEI